MVRGWVDGWMGVDGMLGNGTLKWVHSRTCRLGLILVV
jgi:hypothetical protein